VLESIELPPIPTSVAAARRWSGEVLERLGAPQLADTMALLVSELVSNVVLHARTACWLRIDQQDRSIRVEVDDGDDVLPGEIVVPDPLASSGRGLVLVDALSAAHGVEALARGGKRVWFELAVDGSDALAPPKASVNGTSA